MSTRIMPPTRILRFRAVLFALAVAAAVAWVILNPRRPAPPPFAAYTPGLVTIGGNTMGGTWSVKLHGLPPPVTVGSLRPQGVLDDLEQQMSTYRSSSWVFRFNNYRGTDWFGVPEPVAQVVSTAQTVSEQTGGAFDVTVAPLVDAWGFGPIVTGLRAGQIPSERAIEDAREHVDFRKLHVRLSPPALRKDDPELQIDLSAIAKGYAAGELADKFEDDLKVTNMLVAVGGELRATGVAPDGRPWPVGIEVPAPDTRRILRTLELRDAALSTSGDYRNFVEVAGQRFSHEIDPRTGRPITGNLASVSVVHPDSAYADAMATGLMVLGPDEGFALARRLNLAALFVLRGDGRFETRSTPEFDSIQSAVPAGSRLRFRAVPPAQ